MPRKKSALSTKKKYWYKSKRKSFDATFPDVQTHYFIDNEDSNFLIANEEQIISSEPALSPKKIPRLLSDHNYFSTSETKVEAAEYVDKGINTEITNQSGPCLNPDITKKNVPYVPSHYETLWNDVQSADVKPFLFNTTVSFIQFMEFYSRDKKQSIKWIVKIDEDYRATITIHNQEISSDHHFWIGMPKKFEKVKDIIRLLKKLSSHSVCCGNPDNDFQELIPVGAGISEYNSSKISAYREGDFFAQKGDLTYSSTIRSINCSLLVYDSRCSCCSKYRECLRKRKQRINERKNNPVPNYVHKTCRHSMMDRDTLIVKLKQQRQEIKSLQQENLKMSRSFQQQIRSNGVALNQLESMEMVDLMKTCQSDIEQSYPDASSLQRLFWEQQLRSIKIDNPKNMRWHPMIIRWCLYLRQKSSKAYDAMRDAGFINLPSSRTLFDYSHYTKRNLGLQADTLQILKNECEKLGMFNASEKWKCFCGILFDEIKIKSDLVYDKHTGELIGYVDLDKIGNELIEFEKKSKENNSPDVAKCVLVLMVRGITTSLKFPLAAYATSSITADLLYPIIWRAIHHLEVFLKLKVLFCTCDGATANRKFFNLHRVNNESIVYHTQNPHDESRKIYFISDVPHLLKTTRNCFSNSHSHRNTRKLWKDGRDISWLHIVKLFEEHCELELYNPCPKLSRTHVDLTAYSCMKVNLAAQVLSSTIANALEMLYGDCVIESVKFIRLMNKFFDMLNVRHLFEGRNKRNADLNPYTDPNDDRLNWLENEFLKYFEDWKVSVECRQGEFTKTQLANMQISHQTLTGLKLTVKSITECVKFILNEGAPFVLTTCFNQDPLEQHFSHYRHKGGGNNNPTVYEVRNILTQMRAIGAQAMIPRQGNVQREGPWAANIVDNTPLQRRR